MTWEVFLTNIGLVFNAFFVWAIDIFEALINNKIVVIVLFFAFADLIFIFVTDIIDNIKKEKKHEEE